VRVVHCESRRPSIRIWHVAQADPQIGSVVIVLHAPSDKEVETVDEILDYAARFPFLCYITFVGVFSAYMIYRVVPTHGTKTPLVYLSICSLVGSVSVMAIKVRTRTSVPLA